MQTAPKGWTEVEGGVELPPAPTCHNGHRIVHPEAACAICEASDFDYVPSEMEMVDMARHFGPDDFEM